MKPRTESCGCQHGEGFPPRGYETCVKVREDHDADGKLKPAFWIAPCDLHDRYGMEREMDGFDEGLCK